MTSSRIVPTEAIPVVMLSSNDSEDAVVASLEAGAIDFLVKPFSPRVLLDKLEQVLAKRYLLVHA